MAGIKTTLEDGSFHDVDSSDKAFQLCARRCFRETFKKTKPVLLEPIMTVEVECPELFQGAITETGRRLGRGCTEAATVRI